MNGGGGAGGSAIIEFGANIGNVTGQSLQPFSPSTSGVFLTDNPRVRVNIRAPGRLRRLYVERITPPGAGTSNSYTVRVNGANTAITVTLAGAGSGAGITFQSDNTNEAVVAFGDVVELAEAITAGAPAVSDTKAYLEFVPLG